MHRLPRRKPGNKRRAQDLDWGAMESVKAMDTEAYLRMRCELIDIGRKEEKLAFKEEEAPHVTASHLVKFVEQEVKMPNGIKTGYWFDDAVRLWSEAPETVLCTHAQAILESVCKSRKLPFPWQKDPVMKSVWKHIINHLLPRSRDFVVNTVHPHLCPVDFIDPVTLVRQPSVVDVSTGEVHPRRREHFFSSAYSVVLTEDHIVSSAAFADDPTEHSMRVLYPNVHRFFTNFFCEDYSQVQYTYAQVLPFGKALAYICMTGYTHEKALFFLYGPSCHNAKSALANWVMAMTGPKFGSPLAREGVVNKGRRNRETNTNERMAIKEARVNFVGELKEKDELDDSFLKSIRGKDKIYLKGMYGDPQHVEAASKLVFNTNWPPNIKSDDAAMVEAVWTVLLLARFLVPHELKTFVGSPEEASAKSAYPHAKKIGYLRDDAWGESLKRDAKEELFSWLLAMSILYHKDGRVLRPHPLWVTAKSAMMNEQDYTLQFLREALEPAKDEAENNTPYTRRSFLTRKEVWDMYSRYVCCDSV